MMSYLASYSEVSRPLFLAFTIYYLVECLLRYLVGTHLHNHTFQSVLRSSYKEPVYYGILLGAIISLFSTPFCLSALWASNPFSPLPPTFSTSAEICITSRTVLFISELNRLDMYPAYIYHHLGSIAAVLSALHLGAPELLYLPFTTLVSEIPGDLIWILTAHRDLRDSSSFARWGESWRHTVKCVNFWMYAVFRVPSIPAMAYTFWVAIEKYQWTGQRAVVFVSWVSIILGSYSFWIWRYLRSQSRTSVAPAEVTVVRDTATTEKLAKANDVNKVAASKAWTYSFDHPIHVQLPSNIILTLYGPLMGLALSSLTLVSFTLTHGPLQLLAVSLSVTVMFAVLFARILCLVYEDTIPVFLRDPIRVFLRPGFWLHGGVFGAALGLSLCSYVLKLVDIRQVVPALCIGFPLYESISRLGCHTYGCCYGRIVRPGETSSSSLLKIFSPVTYVTYSAAAVRHQPNLRGKPLYPIQKISSCLFFAQFVAILLLLAVGRLDKGTAGGISLTIHAIIRLWTEFYRNDFRGEIWGIVPLTATGQIALLQCFVGLFMSLVWRAETVSIGSMDICNILTDTSAVICLVFIFGLGTAVYGLHKGGIGKGIVG
ncbi:hypothetical protein D9758_000909 [Tetrapyrgos nigripes]|uniref:Prolipoprotein diacylglyceryl transferase n=1 Tax=Tetrapyrgos nigripes TaxID=182062 RepID=A0A8H5LY31_9AGAR|nr:hypothetical protein D9758_000909 [Tetrapyrgos nigripes]